MREDHGRTASMQFIGQLDVIELIAIHGPPPVSADFSYIEPVVN